MFYIGKDITTAMPYTCRNSGPIRLSNTTVLDSSLIEKNPSYQCSVLCDKNKDCNEYYQLNFSALNSTACTLFNKNNQNDSNAPLFNLNKPVDKTQYETYCTKTLSPDDNTKSKKITNGTTIMYIVLAIIMTIILFIILYMYFK